MQSFVLIKLSTLYNYFEYKCKYRLTILKMNLQGVLLLRKTCFLGSQFPGLFSAQPCSPRGLWFRHALRGYAFQMHVYLPAGLEGTLKRMHNYCLQTTHDTMCFLSGIFKRDKTPQNWMIWLRNILKTTPHPDPQSGGHCYWKLKFSTKCSMFKH